MNPSLDRKPEPLAAEAMAALLLRPRAEAVGAPILLRRSVAGVPMELSREDREQLIADARAGKLVSLTVEAVTFIQRKAPNRNFQRYANKTLKKFAASFRGMPVLRDHAWDDLSARLGTITDSVIEDHPGEEGAKQFRMTLTLTDPAGVEAALRGHIDRFSIGAVSADYPSCSICGETMISTWLGVLAECEHVLGEEYDGEICQLEYTDATGVEVSAVTVPAVEGTGVSDIRAQLSAARASRPARAQGDIRMKTIAIALLAPLLGLGTDVEEGAVVAGVEKLKLDFEGARAELLDVRGQLATANTELATARAQATEQRKATLLKRGLDEGRWVPNSKSAAHAEKLAARGDLDGLEAWLEDLPAGAAAPTQHGLRLQSAGGDPTPSSNGEITELSERQLKHCKDMGIEPADYLKTLNKNRR